MTTMGRQGLASRGSCDTWTRSDKLAAMDLSEGESLTLILHRKAEQTQDGATNEHGKRDLNYDQALIAPPNLPSPRIGLSL